MKISALLLLLAVSACKRAEAPAADPFPVRETAGGVPMIDFDSPESKFSCLAPRDWNIQPAKHLDPAKGTAFIGKGRGISILRYPEAEPQWSDAQKFADSFWMIGDGQQPKVAKEKIGDLTVLRFHQERTSLIPHTRKQSAPQRYDYALFPVKGGFVEIRHEAPANDYQSSLPVFDAVVRSFKLRP